MRSDRQRPDRSADVAAQSGVITGRRGRPQGHHPVAPGVACCTLPARAAAGAAVALTTADTHRMAALSGLCMYEHLYKSHILRIQCANCLVYMLGGGFFVGSSTLFFPAMEEIVYHGGWLYITGCVLTLSGALLAMFTAFEMKRTALPMRFAAPPSRLVLPFWTDEGATIVSCSLYIAGNLAFIVGSACFFPKVVEAGGILIEMLAVILFVIGSALFLTGALIDLIVLVRAPLLLRPPSAPQMRGLT